MLANIAVLITAVTGLVTATGSFVAMLVVVRRTSPRERRDAAAGAAEKVLMPPHPVLELASTMVELDERGDDDGHGKRQGRHK